MLRRRKLIQSQNDLEVAGKVGMLAFSDQQYPSAIDNRVSAAAIVDILNVNAMPLAYLQDRSDSVPPLLLESEEFRAEIEGHRVKYDRWKRAFRTVRDLFIANRVDYVFIKSPSLFPYTSGNLDVMVQEQDFAKAGRLLEEIGFIELKNIREPHKYLYKQFDCGKEVIAIHLHSRIFWGATFVEPDSPWPRANQRPIFDDVVRSLSPEDCMLTTFAHSFYENSAIRLLDLCIVKYLVENEAVDWSYLSNSARTARWEDGFHLSVLAYGRLHQRIFGNPLFPPDVLNGARAFTDRHILLRQAAHQLEKAKVTLPFYLPLVTSKLLGYGKIGRSPEFGRVDQRLRHLAKLMTEVLFIHILKLNPQRGMLVSISGVDGGGKTSYAHALVEALQQCGLDTHYVWTRVGSQKGLQSVAKRLARKPATSAKTDACLPASDRFQTTRALLSHRWRYIGWKIVNVLDLCLFYNVVLRTKLLRRRVVVCDRYVPDMFVDLHLYSEEKPRLIWLKVLDWLLPRSRVGILLTVPEELAHKRSNDPECLDALRTQTQLYIQTRNQLELTVIDNGYRELRDVCNDLVSRIIGQYYSRKCVWFGWDQDK